MRVEFLPEAEAEFERERDRYEAIRAGLGTEFVSEVRIVVGQLAAGPLHFQKVATGRARRAVLTQFPFKIVYLVYSDLIRVIAVAHQHQRPNYWRSRA